LSFTHHSKSTEADLGGVEAGLPTSAVGPAQIVTMAILHLPREQREQTVRGGTDASTQPCVYLHDTTGIEGLAPSASGLHKRGFQGTHRSSMGPKRAMGDRNQRCGRRRYNKGRGTTKRGKVCKHSLLLEEMACGALCHLSNLGKDGVERLATFGKLSLASGLSAVARTKAGSYHRGAGKLKNFRQTPLVYYRRGSSYSRVFCVSKGKPTLTSLITISPSRGREPFPGAGINKRVTGNVPFHYGAK